MSTTTFTYQGAVFEVCRPLNGACQYRNVSHGHWRPADAVLHCSMVSRYFRAALWSAVQRVCERCLQPTA